MSNIKYNIIKLLSKLSVKVFPILPSGGNSFPGLLFLKLAGWNKLNELAKDQVDSGSILVTGTNGKTTTTRMIIDLLSNDMELSTSVGNNTIYSLTTGLIKNHSKLGVFEYGIRDIEHGTPEQVQKLIEPIGVIYTNISREHTQVLGEKKDYKEYIRAKTLLSKGMDKGVIITNCDDPNTANIGMNKQNDVKVNYYGFDIDLDDIFDKESVNCPVCDKKLTYEKYFLNHRGVYLCDCGFKRPEPDIKLTKLEKSSDKWTITIEGLVYNYLLDKKISLNVTVNIPVLGIHNLYNILTSITAYITFTDNDKNIKETIENYYNNLDFSILPPGRFEIINFDDKLVGIGQGDNGDALKVNTLMMHLYSEGNDVEFIYTTPDEYEDDIFEDHKASIKAIKPKHLAVVPGRVSVTKAEEYYNQIKDEYNSDFYPVEFDFEKRITKILDLIKQSDCKYVLVSGCGEEQLVWDEVKKRLTN